MAEPARLITPHLRVMTWNVHGTFALNPAFDVQRAIELIHDWMPDIVAIQEIDSRGRSHDPFRQFGEALGGNSVGARSIVTTDGDYGQMLVSRWGWESPPEISDISFGEREPRRAICADVATPLGAVRIIATHLGLSVRERREQARSLLRLATEAHHPALVLGDFNDWFWINSVRGALAERFPVRTRHRTFPSRFPLMRLDRIYGYRVKIERSFIDHRARAISDHLPVIADIIPLADAPEGTATNSLVA